MSVMEHNVTGALPVGGVSVREDTSFDDAALKHAKSSAGFLGAEEEILLLRAWQERCDADARNRVVQAHLPMIMKYIKTNTNQKMERDDLYQEAVMGLMRAADRFDVEKGVRFSTYARWWVSAGVQVHQVKMHSVVAVGGVFKKPGTFRKFPAILAQVESDAILGNEDLTRDEIMERASERFNLDPALVKKSVHHLTCSDTSLSAPIHEGMTLEDIQESDMPSGEASTINNERLLGYHEIINVGMRALKPREADILKRRMMQETPERLRDIAEDYSLSKERVRQIEVEATRKFRLAITRNSDAKVLLESVFVT